MDFFFRASLRVGWVGRSAIPSHLWIIYLFSRQLLIDLSNISTVEFCFRKQSKNLYTDPYIYKLLLALALFILHILLYSIFELNNG
jgi:hypothetical protein